jgi:uncharacterized protein (DUF427 family)
VTPTPKVTDAAWRYQRLPPLKGAAGHVAFYPDRVRVTSIAE